MLDRLRSISLSIACQYLSWTTYEDVVSDVTSKTASSQKGSSAYQGRGERAYSSTASSVVASGGSSRIVSTYSAMGDFDMISRTNWPAFTITVLSMAELN